MSYVLAVLTAVHSKYTEVSELARHIVIPFGGDGIALLELEKSDHSL